MERFMNYIQVIVPRNNKIIFDIDRDRMSKWCWMKPEVLQWMSKCIGAEVNQEDIRLNDFRNHDFYRDNTNRDHVIFCFRSLVFLHIFTNFI